MKKMLFLIMVLLLTTSVIAFTCDDLEAEIDVQTYSDEAIIRYISSEGLEVEIPYHYNPLIGRISPGTDTDEVMLLPGETYYGNPEGAMLFYTKSDGSSRILEIDDLDCQNYETTIKDLTTDSVYFKDHDITCDGNLLDLYSPSLGHLPLRFNLSFVKFEKQTANGAATPKTNTGATITVNSDGIMILKNGVTVKYVLVYSNVDSEVEFLTSCSGGITCTDTDGGKNYSVKGTTTERRSDGSTRTFTDYCIGETAINEHYCSNEGLLMQIGTPCSTQIPGTVCNNGACVAETSLPDLTVISASWVPSPARLGSKMSKLYMTIKNIGTKRVDLPSVEIRIQKDNSYFYEVGSTSPLYSLNPGEEKKVDLSSLLSRIPSFSGGNYKLYAEVDPDLKFTELNENNNIKTYSFNVPYQYECTDTDGGVLPYTKGTCTDSRGTIVKDRCLNEDGSGPVSEGAYVIEAFCLTDEMREYCKNSNGDDYCDNLRNDCYYAPLIPTENLAWSYFPRETKYFCPNGCKDGVCLEEQNTTCTDSDNGKNYYEFGSTIYTAPGIYDKDDDTCINSNTLSEQYCVNAQQKNNVLYYCPNGCSNGVCKTNQTAVCTDTDGGKNYYVKGKTYGENSCDGGCGPNGEGGQRIQNWYDYCLDETKLYEFSCSVETNPQADSLNVWADLYSCPQGCENGACKTNQTAVCTDTDGGENYYKKGITKGKLLGGQDYTHTDRCILDKGNGGFQYVSSCNSEECAVEEASCRWCDSSIGNCGTYKGYYIHKEGSNYYHCPNGCSNGACLGNEADTDKDGVKDSEDNCILIYNPDQKDSDNDNTGDFCDICTYDSLNDIDKDNVCGNIDNCPSKYNPDQKDSDNDNIGDACDAIIPEKCQFSAGIDCVDKANICTDTERIEFVLRNNIGFDIKPLEVKTDDCVMGVRGFSPSTVKNNNLFTVYLGCKNLEQGSHEFDIELTYENLETGLKHTVEGIISGKATSCSTPVLCEGGLQCFGNYIQKCYSDSGWSNIEYCPSGCNDGGCISDCGDGTCDSEELYSCSEDCDMYKNTLILKDLWPYQFKHATYDKESNSGYGDTISYRAIYYQGSHELEATVIALENTETAYKAFKQEILSEGKYTIEKINGNIVYLVDDMYVWVYKNYIIGIEKEVRNSYPNSVQTQEVKSNSITGNVVKDMAQAKQTLQTAAEKLQKIKSRLTEQAQQYLDAVEEYEIPSYNMPQRPESVIEAYLDKYPSEETHTIVCGDGICDYSEKQSCSLDCQNTVACPDFMINEDKLDECLSEGGNWISNEKDNNGCLLPPYCVGVSHNLTEIDKFNILVKLETLSLKITEMRNKATALSNYHRKLGNENSADAWEQAAEDFKNLNDKITAVKKSIDSSSSETVKVIMRDFVNTVKSDLQDIISVLLIGLEVQ